jgi:hypothetical protein
MIIGLDAKWSPWQHFAVKVDDHGWRKAQG